MARVGAKHRSLSLVSHLRIHVAQASVAVDALPALPWLEIAGRIVRQGHALLSRQVLHGVGVTRQELATQLEE